MRCGLSCPPAFLTRALQIAWPNAEFHAVAVARNMKAGELGRGQTSSPRQKHFRKESKPDEEPPFPSVNTYDGKAWRYIPKNTGRRVLFWNVGAQPVLNDDSIYNTTDSYRDWGDLRDWNDNQTDHGATRTGGRSLWGDSLGVPVNLYLRTGRRRSSSIMV